MDLTKKNKKASVTFPDRNMALSPWAIIYQRHINNDYDSTIVIIEMACSTFPFCRQNCTQGKASQNSTLIVFITLWLVDLDIVVQQVWNIHQSEIIGLKKCTSRRAHDSCFKTLHAPDRYKCTFRMKLVKPKRPRCVVCMPT